MGLVYRRCAMILAQACMHALHPREACWCSSGCRLYVAVEWATICVWGVLAIRPRSAFDASGRRGRRHQEETCLRLGANHEVVVRSGLISAVREVARSSAFARRRLCHFRRGVD